MKKASVDGDVEQMELPDTAGGKAKWFIHFGNSLIVSDNKHIAVIPPSNPIPRYIP